MGFHRNFVVSCAIAATLAALAVGFWASAANGASHRNAELASLVIHESFRRPHCSGTPSDRTGLQIEGCTEMQVLTLDKQISNLNRNLYFDMVGGTSRRIFVASNRAWLQYRYDSCLSVADQYGAGTVKTVMFLRCIAGVDQRHIAALEEFTTTTADS
ncbi:MAG: hypothetical protein ACP5H2_04260 [Solirubrobacteraceae bacterium]